MLWWRKRNDSREMLLHLEMYRPFNIIQLSSNNYKSCYQTSEEFVLLLPYKQPVICHLEVHCLRTDDVTCSRYNTDYAEVVDVTNIS